MKTPTSKVAAKKVAAKKVAAKKVAAKKFAAKKVVTGTRAPGKGAAKKLPVARVAQTAAARSRSLSSPPTRFAHPFFTLTPQADRATVPGVGKNLLDHIQGNLQPVPLPTREPTFALAEVIGQAGTDEITAAGSILFHTCGDTGRGADTPQGIVATAMQLDFNVAQPAASPAFFFHLGDVIYGQNKDARYLAEFYEPYVHYAGKIVGIAGNHDGEVLPTTDPTTLHAFLANFCAPTQTVPVVAGTIYRETMNQPGVYFLLDAPFLQIVALYSNAAENPGFISGAIPGAAQKDWLLKTLKTIAADRKAGKRKALIFATHHPPYTAGGHSPSTNMLADIDGVCQQAGIMPDMHLSGHAHSYQRYTRSVQFGGGLMEIPYVVVGTGGINDQAVPQATGQVTGDHTFVQSFKGYGYTLVKVSASSITGIAYIVDPNTQLRTQFESFSVDLLTHTVT